MSDRVRVLAAPDDPWFGPTDAPILAVVTLSPDAATLGDAVAAIDRLTAAHGDGLRVVVKLAPTAADPQAVRRARLLLAAQHQGGFWAAAHCLTAAGERACMAGRGIDLRRLDLLARPELTDPTLIRTQQYATRVGAAVPSIHINGYPVTGPGLFTRIDDVVAREVANVARLGAAHGLEGAEVVEHYLRHARSGPRVERWIERGVRYQVPIEADEIVSGPSTAPVTIVEFGRFDCPYSAEGHKLLRQLQREDPSLRVVFRALPSAGSLDAHRAAVQAARDGRFDEVADAAFAGVAPAPVARTDDERLRRDRGWAAVLGVRSTPTYFVNGVAFEGVPRRDDLLATIAAERQRALELSARRPAEAIYDLAIADGAIGGSTTPPPDPEAPTEPSADVIHDLPVDDAPAVGVAGGPVITLFTDFTCGDCINLDRSLQELRRAHPELRVVYRLTPVPEHVAAARAASIAHAAGPRFAEVAAALYAAGETATVEQLDAVARRFALTVDAAAAEQRIARDLELASTLGVEVLPAVFVDGRYVGDRLDETMLPASSACGEESSSCGR